MMGDEGWADAAIREGIDRIAAVPARMGRAVRGRTDAELRTPAGPEAWTANEILAHVRASDDIMSYRFYAMLARDNPPLPAFDDREWAAVAGYAALDFHEALAGFAVRRAELVRLLRRVPPEGWQRPGTHEVAGAITPASVLAALADHEEEHCAQLETLWSRADE
jgi:hypothetical protein